MRLDPALQRDITRAVLDEHYRVEPIGRHRYKCECGRVVIIDSQFGVRDTKEPYWYEHVRQEINDGLELARKELGLQAG